MESKAVERKLFKSQDVYGKAPVGHIRQLFEEPCNDFSWNVTHCHERDVSTPARYTIDREASLRLCDLENEGFWSLLHETLCQITGIAVLA